jgi:hypothetical protein
MNRVSAFMAANRAIGARLSDWIDRACDDHTFGNGLPRDAAHPTEGSQR